MVSLTQSLQKTFSRRKPSGQIFQKYIRIRTIHLGMILLVMALPLGGIYFLHFYENELVRQTQAELISQASFASSMYLHELKEQAKTEQVKLDQLAGKQTIPQIQQEFWRDTLHPVPAILDLSKDPVLPVRPTPQKTLLNAHPVAQRAGEVLSDIIKTAQGTTLSGVKILDAQGVEVSGQSEQGAYFGEIEEIQQALLGEAVSVLRVREIRHYNPKLESISRGAKLNVYVAYPIMESGKLYGVVYASRTPLDLLKSLYNKRGQIVFGSIFLLLTAFGLALLTSRTITQPIQRLIRQAHFIQEGDAQGLAPIQKPMTREIAILSAQLAEMAQVLQARSEYIRQFAMNVSHEFKTPMTAIQGGIELLQDHGEEMTQAERERFLANMAEDTQRLKVLVNRLLELARAETVQPSVSVESDLMLFLPRLKQRYQEKGLVISWQMDLKPSQTKLLIPMAEEALETVLCNLFDNSLAHHAHALEIEITQNQGIKMRIQDDGEGVSEANATKLFEMFFTTRRESGGTGMGLSIVKALMENHQGQIRYIQDSSVKGACFELTWASSK
jgi:signal transduction histidine kinase